MFNFNDVNKENNLFRSDRVLGRLVRLPLRLIPKGAVLPILQGPGQGLKWVVDSSNHGCWLGSYEFEKQRVIPHLVKEGDVVYDIGAHVGYFTILFAKLVGPSGQVVAFEPFPANFEYLGRHVSLNELRNVVAVQAGVAAKTEIANFAAGSHSSIGRKSEEELGGLPVKVVNLTEFIKERKLRLPNLIKMDIEGAEIEVIPSIIDFLTENKVKILLSTHGDLVTKMLVELLASRGFLVTPLQWGSGPRNRGVFNATLISAVP